MTAVSTLVDLISLGLPWDSRQAEIGLKALCSLPFTAEAVGCKALWQKIPTDIVTLILVIKQLKLELIDGSL